MFWFNKKNKNVVFMDIRKENHTLCDGRKLIINPDVVADFKNIPYPDDYFHLVVFDPPHLIRVGEKSWLRLKYGSLNETWQTEIKEGYIECMRVLKKNGCLIFKWNEDQIKIKDVLEAIPDEPLFGNKTSKNTIWLVFAKM